MRLTALRLQPLGAFHFSTQSDNLESVAITFGSDQLYAALFMENLQSHIFPSWIDDSNPPFRISSCFPYISDVLLLPNPFLQPAPNETFDPALRKYYKKIAFLSEHALKKRLHGESIQPLLEKDIKPHEFPILWQGGAIVIDPEDTAALRLPMPQAKQTAAEYPLPHWKAWEHTERPQVAVDRATNQTQYFALQETWFAPQCGLAVLADGDIEGLSRLLMSLGESGIGGRRSKGLGQFTLAEPLSIDLPDPTTDRQMLLSRYIPNRQELSNDVLGLNSSYQLMTAGGWLSSRHAKAQRRRSIYMLREGSVVNTIRQPLNGAIHDIRPTYLQGEPFSHPVWRHGLALTIGVPWRNA